MKAFAYLFKDPLKGRFSVAIRSVQKDQSNWNAEQITESSLDDAESATRMFRGLISSMEREHQVYWQSALWC